METDPDGPPEVPREVRLRDLRPRSEPIIILARVLRAQRREITRKTDGRPLSLVSGTLTDGTASVRFTWWDPPPDPIEPGDVLRAGPIQLREFRGRLEVTFNRRTRVEPAGPSELVLEPLDQIPLRVLRELQDDEEEVRVDVHVDSVASRTVRVKEAERTLQFGKLHDASGSLPYVAWVDPGWSAGARVRIAGACVRTFRGRRELILDERARIELRPGENPSRS
jgi:ssDNA-binding replication factor A large subunit